MTVPGLERETPSVRDSMTWEGLTEAIGIFLTVPDMDQIKAGLQNQQSSWFHRACCSWGSHDRQTSGRIESQNMLFLNAGRQRS